MWIISRFVLAWTWRCRMFEKIKKYYDDGLWSEERVRKMVEIGKITEDQYKLIIVDSNK